MSERIIEPVDEPWWHTLTPEQQLEQLDTVQLSALLCERVLGWCQVWRNDSTGAWYGQENERQKRETPSPVLDYAGNEQYCLKLMGSFLSGQREWTLAHRPEHPADARYRFWWKPTPDQQLTTPRWYGTFTKAVVMALLVGHTDDLEQSCLSYLWEKRSYRNGKLIEG